MTDDPRDILKAAGVECAEVEKCYRDYYAFGKKDVPWSALDAVEALARLAADGARYKWQRDKLIERLLAERIKVSVKTPHGRDPTESIAEAYRWKDRICVALEGEWEAEHNA